MTLGKYYMGDQLYLTDTSKTVDQPITLWTTESQIKAMLSVYNAEVSHMSTHFFVFSG